jgi:AcrR family transcriptional regulator
MIRGDTTKASIINHTVNLLAANGPSYVSLRRIGREAGIAQSAVYHHFASKDILLTTTFRHMGRSLGMNIAMLPTAPTLREMLVQRIEFQFDNAGTVVAMLKYFMAERSQFHELPARGFVPPQAYRHIADVIERGNAEGAWHIVDVNADAKVIVHAINGFVLEYFPHLPLVQARATLLGSIESFIWRALTNPATRD